MKRADLEVGKLYVFKDGPGPHKVGKLLDLYGTPNTGHRPGYGPGPSSAETRRAARSVTLQLMGWMEVEEETDLTALSSSAYTRGPVEEAVFVPGWEEQPITSQLRLADVLSEWDNDAWAAHQVKEQDRVAREDARKKAVAECKALEPRLRALLERLGLPAEDIGTLASDYHPFLHIDLKLTLAQAVVLLSTYGEESPDGRRV